MADRDLPARMKDYFRRQMQCYEGILLDLEHVERDLEEPELGRIAELQACHAERLRVLEQEFRGLWHEWETAQDLSEAERVEIRSLAGRAQILAERLALVHETALGLIKKGMSGLEGPLRELRRGRALLKKYGGDMSAEADYIDRKA
jgi:hypothetical protein